MPARPTAVETETMPELCPACPTTRTHSHLDPDLVDDPANPLEIVACPCHFPVGSQAYRNLETAIETIGDERHLPISMTVVPGPPATKASGGCSLYHSTFDLYPTDPAELAQAPDVWADVTFETPSGNRLNATGGVFMYGDTDGDGQSEWGGMGDFETSKARLVFSPQNYASRTPNTATLAHEIGHMFGFTEQRWRGVAGTTLHGMTATNSGLMGARVYHEDQPEAEPLTAYSKALLEDYYPGDRTTAVDRGDDWRMHHVLVGLDPLHLADKSSDDSMLHFEDRNPKYLKKVDGTYRSCRTERRPHFLMSYSDLSNNPNTSGTVKAFWLLSERPSAPGAPAASSSLAMAEHEAQPASATPYVQWQWGERLTIDDDDLRGANLPVPTAPTDVTQGTIVAAINPDRPRHSPRPEVGPGGPGLPGAASPYADNEVETTVYFFSGNTTDPRCADATREPSTPQADGRYGAAIATFGNLVLTGAPGAGRLTLDAVDRTTGVSATLNTFSAGPQGIELGAAVAVTQVDGFRYLAAGAPGRADDTLADSGSVYLFKQDLSSLAWSAADELRNPFPQAYARFGAAVALAKNDDGAYLLVGSPGGGFGGFVDVWRVDTAAVAEDWPFFYHLLDPQPGASFGAAVAANNKAGQTWVVVGAPLEDLGVRRDAGAAYLYRLDASAPVLEQKMTGLQDEAFFGTAVSIHNATLIVGAPGEDYAAGGEMVVDGGVARVYRYPEPDEGSGWTQAAILRPNDGMPGDGFGSSVANYRSSIVVGAPFHDDADGGAGPIADAGAVYAFLPTYTNNLEVTFKRAGFAATARQPAAGFGTAVAALDHWLFLVGAPLQDLAGTNGAGAVSRIPFTAGKPDHP